jgi:hypothetical protein
MTETDGAPLQERLKKAAKPKQPGPAKNIGDNSPNPLPDDADDIDNKGGGDAGRT